MSLAERPASQQTTVAALWLLALAPRDLADLAAAGQPANMVDAMCATGLVDIDDRPESHRGARRGTPQVTITADGWRVLAAEVWP